MPVCPEDFFAVAELSDAAREIQRRNAISRSYYAVFHEASAYREALGLTLPSGNNAGVHKKLCLAFQVSTDLELRAIGDNMDRQRLRRKRADYDLSGTIGLREATRAVAANKSLFAQLKQAPA